MIDEKDIVAKKVDEEDKRKLLRILSTEDSDHEYEIKKGRGRRSFV